MMDVQAFYKTLARVVSERTETEIKVKEITENDSRNSGDNNGRVQETCA
jgi:hypothetical protein